MNMYGKFNDVDMEDFYFLYWRILFLFFQDVLTTAKQSTVVSQQW